MRESPERTLRFAVVRGAWLVTKRSVVSFYDDQGTHHAAALTYYALMSLFPTLLLAVSLLGLLGEYPATYNAIVGHLRGVVPAVTLAPLDGRGASCAEEQGHRRGSARPGDRDGSVWGYRLPRGRAARPRRRLRGAARAQLRAPQAN